MIRSAIVALACLMFAAPARLAHGPAAGQAQPTVRFHHIHYRVGDPAAAMNAVAPKVDGVRIVVPGLGAGVRASAEYLFFDRMDESDAPSLEQPPVAAALAAAVTWLAARGVRVAPGEPAQLRLEELAGVRYHHVAFVADDLTAVVQALTAAGALRLRSSDDAVLFEAGGCGWRSYATRINPTSSGARCTPMYDRQRPVRAASAA